MATSAFVEVLPLLELSPTNHRHLVFNLKQIIPRRFKRDARTSRGEQIFDAKPVYTLEFLYQKLDYIHHSPVSGKWNLCGEFTDYPRSSAAFYELGVTHPSADLYDYRNYWFG